MVFKKIEELIPNVIYTVLKVFWINTRIGKSVVLELDDDVCVHLPPRYARPLLENYYTYRDFQKETMCFEFLSMREGNGYFFAEIDFPIVRNPVTFCFCKVKDEKCANCVCGEEEIPSSYECPCTVKRVRNWSNLKKKVNDAFVPVIDDCENKSLPVTDVNEKK